MSISAKTRKMLWGRSANRCSICHLELYMDASETDDVSIVGDECHIIAKEQEGPRGNSDFPTEKRDLFDNLILLCKNHHKLVDDQPSTYTVERLHEIKDRHIQWVNDALQVDSEKQQDEEYLLAVIDRWGDLAGIDHWEAWTSSIFTNGQPRLNGLRNSKLSDLVNYLFTRVYPNRYPEVQRALGNFMHVLNDFLNVFHKHSEVFHEGYITAKFYRSQGYLDDARYAQLAREFNFHVDLVDDLGLELTRSGNYVCETVRRYLLRSYRLLEGILTVESGPNEDLKFHRYRPQYREEEKEILYPGLKEFLQIRTTRDRSFGVGINSQDPRFLAREADFP